MAEPPKLIDIRTGLTESALQSLRVSGELYFAHKSEALGVIGCQSAPDGDPSRMTLLIVKSDRNSSRPGEAVTRWNVQDHHETWERVLGMFRAGDVIDLTWGIDHLMIETSSPAPLHISIHVVIGSKNHRDSVLAVFM
jgi:hypothetical protein